MKVLSMMKKAALSVCAVVLGACCWNIATAQDVPVQENYIEAKAETTSTAKVKAVANDATATLDYVYIYFDGFNTKVSYDEPAADDYVFRNIFINGTSIHDINKNTDVTGWEWDIFPQTEQANYRKPVITFTIADIPKGQSTGVNGCKSRRYGFTLKNLRERETNA